MPTFPAAKAPFGSTQRPVQLILFTAPLSDAFANRSTTATALGVLNAGRFRSGPSSSTPFIANNGQYSQSKFSVRNPVLSADAILPAASSSASKLAGGPAMPAFWNIGLFQNSSVLAT